MHSRISRLNPELNLDETHNIVMGEHTCHCQDECCADERNFTLTLL